MAARGGNSNSKQQEPARGIVTRDSDAKKAGNGVTLIDSSLGERGDGRLMLVVSEHGRKSWIYRQRRLGHDTTRKIGEYPAMTLKQARDEARGFATSEHKLARAGTFGALLDNYVKHLETEGAASWKDTRGELLRAVPEDDPLRKREARSITTRDILVILRDRKREARSFTVRRNRLRAMLSAAFNHARKGENDEDHMDEAATFMLESNFNPVRDIPVKKEYETPRDRVLTRREAQEFFAAMSTLNHTPLRQSIGALWCLVLLSGQRLVQLHKAERHRGVLVLTDMKGRGGREKKRKHEVPMTPLMRALWDESEGARIANVYTVRDEANAVLKKIAPGAVPMDIRRTVETTLKGLGVSRDECGDLLSHGRSGVQAKHYEKTTPEIISRRLALLRLLEAWLFPVVMS